MLSSLPDHQCMFWRTPTRVCVGSMWSHSIAIIFQVDVIVLGLHSTCPRTRRASWLGPKNSSRYLSKVQNLSSYFNSNSSWYIFKIKNPSNYLNSNSSRYLSEIENLSSYLNDNSSRYLSEVENPSRYSTVILLDISSGSRIWVVTTIVGFHSWAWDDLTI